MPAVSQVANLRGRGVERTLHVSGRLSCYRRLRRLATCDTADMAVDKAVCATQRWLTARKNRFPFGSGHLTRSGGKVVWNREHHADTGARKAGGFADRERTFQERRGRGDGSAQLACGRYPLRCASISCRLVIAFIHFGSQRRGSQDGERELPQSGGMVKRWEVWTFDFPAAGSSDGYPLPAKIPGYSRRTPASIRG